MIPCSRCGHCEECLARSSIFLLSGKAPRVLRGRSRQDLVPIAQRLDSWDKRTSHYNAIVERWLKRLEPTPAPPRYRTSEEAMFARAMRRTMSSMSRQKVQHYDPRSVTVTIGGQRIGVDLAYDGTYGWNGEAISVGYVDEEPALVWHWVKCGRYTKPKPVSNAERAMGAAPWTSDTKRETWDKGRRSSSH